MWISGAAALLDQGGDAANFEGFLELVEAVSLVAHDLARLGGVAKLRGQLKQRVLPLGTLLNGGHRVFFSTRFGIHQSLPETAVAALTSS